MPRVVHLPSAENLSTYQQTVNTMTRFIKQQARSDAALNILEAGCGTLWGLNLGTIPYRLTGVDMDERALDLRKNGLKDLDVAIHGDLRTIVLDPDSYDAIFSSNVLEHVADAEGVLDNFARWLRPGGIMLLTFPNRDSATGFLTRVTPFWLHVLFKRYLQGVKDAGKPGHDPYPTCFCQVVSRRGMRAFCARHRLTIRAEYRLDRRPVKSKAIWGVISLLLWLLRLASCGQLSMDHRGLLYVIEKPGNGVAL